MKFYIGSSFKNIDNVRYLRDKLKEMGLTHTYDWTQNQRALTVNQLREIGQSEKAAVIESDFVVILLPAGKGSHIELGMALGQNKKVYLHSSTGEIENFETTSTFYHLPEVESCKGTLDDLTEVIKSQLLI